GEEPRRARSSSAPPAPWRRRGPRRPASPPTGRACPRPPTSARRSSASRASRLSAGRAPVLPSRAMTDDARPLAIDCWLNPTTGLGDHPPEYLVRVAREYFKREK